MKKNLLALICIMSINIANAQNVNIPDLQFKGTLLNNPAINTNGDGEIQVAEAAAYSGGINAFNMGIYDLTGIEAFTALDNLDCSYNYLTSLNMSTNTSLTGLWCDNNQLTSLDVSANTALTLFSCQSNQLTSLDVSANTTLTWLYCQSNQLTSLNVQNGNNSNFTNFNATSNPNLTCIQVDNVAYSNANWSAYKDAGASFSANCNGQCTSQGANSGSVFVSVAGFNTLPWSQPQNAQSSDNSYASVGLSPSGPYSEYLQATGFGFSIPTTASICGIEVNVERSSSGSIPVNDFEIHVVKNNAVTGLNYAYNLSWSTTDSVVTYGSNSDLWGTTWTPAEINNSSFGAAVSASKSGPLSSSAKVDQITIKVFYDNSTGIANNTACNDEIRIFPNPASNHLTIALGSINKNVEVTFADITGKIIYSTSTFGAQKIEVNTQDFAEGIYVVQIQSADFIGTKKLVIEK